MIQPVNNHILIKPLEHKTYLPTEKGVYEEVGVIVGINETWNLAKLVPVGTKIWFDAWLASKYATGEGDDYLWLVNWDDVRAMELQE